MNRKQLLYPNSCYDEQQRLSNVRTWPGFRLSPPVKSICTSYLVISTLTTISILSYQAT